MESSKIPLLNWAITIYQLATNVKGISNLKIHRALTISYSCSWHLSHRSREAWNQFTASKFDGPVEVHETNVGCKEGNKHAGDKLNAGRGTVGKAAVAGMKNRHKKEIRATVVENTNRETRQGFV